MNILIFLATATFLITSPSYAEIGPILEYLSKVKVHSFDGSLSSLEKERAQNLNEKSLAPFFTSAFLAGSFSETKEPATSPFSSELTRSTDFTLGVSKLWKMGVKTSLDYSLNDRFVDYSSRTDLDYKNPSVGLSFSTDLFQDLFSNRLSSLAARSIKNKKQIDLESKIKNKTTLVKSMLELAELLEFKDDLSLQKELCQKTSSQVAKLERKFKRGSVAKRDFLLGKKEYNLCQSRLKSLGKNIVLKSSDLLVKFGVRKQDIKNFTIDYFFKEVSSLYAQNDFSTKKPDFESTDEVIYLKVGHDIAMMKNYESQILSRVSADMELKVGMSASNSTFSSAQSDLSKREHPYLFVGVTLQLPFDKDESEIEAANSYVEKEILFQRLNQKRKEKKERFLFIQESLKRDLEIFANYKKNVSLSKDILSEARRDFNNGKIDFFSLVEFQKGLIISQRDLAITRTQIIAKTIEYIDYYNFFDRLL